MRTGGNLAYNEAATKDTHVHTGKKSTVKHPKRASGASYAVAVFYIVIIFAIAFFIVMREVNIAQESNTVNSLKVQLEDARTRNKRAELDLESSVDLKRIEQIATEKYGMARPEKNQIVYINVRQNDFTEEVSKKDAVAALSGSVGDGIKNLFGIFSVQ